MARPPGFFNLSLDETKPRLPPPLLLPEHAAAESRTGIEPAALCLARRQTWLSAESPDCVSNGVHRFLH